MTAELQPSPTFLAGGGDMGQRIRDRAWQATPLGEPARWPPALRTTLRILLSTQHPVFLFWGPQHLCFYNDAYSRSLGPEKHPAILGQPGRQAWAEIWDLIGPQIEQVMAGGEATWHENQLVPIVRYGRLQDVYWTYSYGPVDDDTAPGGIGGVLVLCNETTGQVLAEQRARADRDRWLALFDHAPGFTAVLEGPEHRFSYVNTAYQRLVNGRAVPGRTVLECLPEVAEQGFIALLDGVFSSGRPHVGQATPVVLADADGRAGVTLFVDFVYEAVRDGDDRIIGVLAQGHDVTAHVQALRSLDTTLASITDGFLACDADGRLDELNAAAQQMLGVQAASVMGRPFEEVLGLAADSPLLAHFDRSRRGGKGGWLEHTRPDGRCLELRLHPRAGGGLAVYFHDITARRDSDAALRQSERRARARADELEAVMRATPAAIFLAQDRECRFVTGNPQSYQLLRMPEGENASASAPKPPTRRFVEHRDGRPVPAHELPLQRAAREGRVVEKAELTLVFDDGEVRTIFGGAAPLFDEQGAVRGAVAVFVDITEQKQAMARLAQREREMRTLADNTPDVLARFDRAHRHVFVNSAIERASGKRPEEIIGRTNRELAMPEPLLAQWEQAVEQVFTSGQPTEILFEFDSPDQRRWFTSRLVPEFDERQVVQHVLAIVQDTTERRRAEQALRDAERRKDEFLAILSHELRNPLAPLRNGLALLERTPGSPQAAALCTMMQRQLAQLVRLVDELLDVSRISAGKMMLRREPVTLQAVVALALEGAQPFIEASQHRLCQRAPEQPLWVTGDATRLAQVVANLLSNAVKYTPAGGCIELTLDAADGQARLQVKDNGLGIPPQMLEDVFQLFAQVDSTLHRAQGGLGIGLALARSIMALHGGRLSARSEGLGRGSCFVCTLPLIATPWADATAAPGRPAADGPPRLRVLVADDNTDAAETLAMLLQGWGCETRVAGDGEMALDIALAWQPHLALLDIGMPRLDGYALARRLRAQGSSARLVAVTGWGAPADQQRASEAGFDHHLVKPVDPDRLHRLLQAHKPAEGAR